ncbi:MAG: hypothetical protein HY716_06080 [Planctomycetes bacterium]|nr:hypothetical protein [Planctomycetota bacterium]
MAGAISSGVLCLIAWYLEISLIAYFGLLFSLLCPVAWYLGTVYEKECVLLDREPDRTGIAGKRLGIAATIILVLAVLSYVASRLFVGISGSM